MDDQKNSAAIDDEIAAAEADLAAARERLEAARAKRSVVAEPAAPAEAAGPASALEPIPVAAGPISEPLEAGSGEARASEPSFEAYEPPAATEGAAASEARADYAAAGAATAGAAAAGADAQGQRPYDPRTATQAAGDYAAQPGGYVPPESSQTPHAGPGAVPPQQPYASYYQQQPYQQAPYQQPYAQPVASKDHVAAGLLAIFLGSLGIHKFYLGYNTQGFIMLAITIVGSIFSFGIAAFVMVIIALVEGIIYLTKSQTEFEQNYVFNKKEWF